MLAIIKDNDNNIKHIEDNKSTNKQTFKNELRNNGIKIIEVLNNKDLNIIKNTSYNDLLLNTKYKEDAIEYIKQVLQ